LEIRRGKKRLSRDSNPVLVDAEGDQVNTELLMSQSSYLNFLHIMLLSFEIGFLGVWFSRRSKRARSYLHSCRANRGSQKRGKAFAATPVGVIDSWTVRHFHDFLCSFCGTEAYLAPEMILRQPYGASVDFWQYGCFVYELYAGRSPFWLPRKPRKFIRDNILNGVFAYPSVVPEAARGITGALLQVRSRLPLGVEGKISTVSLCAPCNNL